MRAFLTALDIMEIARPDQIGPRFLFIERKNTMMDKVIAFIAAAQRGDMETAMTILTPLMEKTLGEYEEMRSTTVSANKAVALYLPRLVAAVEKANFINRIMLSAVYGKYNAGKLSKKAVRPSKARKGRKK